MERIFRKKIVDAINLINSSFYYYQSLDTVQRKLVKLGYNPEKSQQRRMQLQGNLSTIYGNTFVEAIYKKEKHDVIGKSDFEQQKLFFKPDATDTFTEIIEMVKYTIVECTIQK